MRVWVDGWQEECCGDGFAVGDAVAWPVGAPDAAFLGALLGDVTVAYAQETHDEASAEVAGTVVAIHRVSARVARDAKDRVYRAVAGTGLALPVASAGVVGEATGRQFFGWVVELDGAEVRPPRPPG
ncbi:MAG TPA: DUF6578 domain-containing protein [Frankiaceae bacterium]|nr:DUF6578 domain-containing protein [Frankiaceae bacterium]